MTMSTDEDAREVAYYGNRRTREARENADRLAAEPRPVKSTGSKAVDMVGMAIAGIVILGVLVFAAGVIAWGCVIVWRHVL
jgi:hypothetical protein